MRSAGMTAGDAANYLAWERGLTATARPWTWQAVAALEFLGWLAARGELADDMGAEGQPRVGHALYIEVGGLIHTRYRSAWDVLSCPAACPIPLDGEYPEVLAAVIEECDEDRLAECCFPRSPEAA